MFHTYCGGMLLLCFEDKTNVDTTVYLIAKIATRILEVAKMFKSKTKVPAPPRPGETICVGPHKYEFI